MEDNSIITKFELSDREKQLRAKFFGSNSNSKPNNNNSSMNNNNINNINMQDTNIGRTVKEETKNNFCPNVTDEDINKFMAENSGYAMNPFNQNLGMSNQQMNMIMTQNKIMCRNADILQEQNKALHDFILYNMRKDQILKNVKTKNEVDPNQINQLLQPLYKNLSDLQNEIKNINNNNQKKIELEESKQNYQNASQNFILKEQLNNKVNNLVEDIQQQNKRRQSSNLSKGGISSTSNIRTRAVNNQNAPIIKAMNEIKNSMTDMTKEIANMETNFQKKLNEVMENSEKNNLNDIMNLSIVKKNTLNPNINKNQGEEGNGSVFSSKNLEEIDYTKYKKDLIDINNESQKLMEEYKASKPKFNELVKPKKKISYDYNVDYPTTTSGSLNSSTHSIFKKDSKKNVFNHNLSNASGKHSSQNIRPKKQRESSSQYPYINEQQNYYDDYHNQSYNQPNYPQQQEFINPNPNINSQQTNYSQNINSIQPFNNNNQSPYNNISQSSNFPPKEQSKPMNQEDAMNAYRQKMMENKNKIETVNYLNTSNNNSFQPQNNQGQKVSSFNSRVANEKYSPYPPYQNITNNPPKPEIEPYCQSNIPKEKQEYKIGQLKINEVGDLAGGTILNDNPRKEIKMIDVLPKEVREKAILEDMIMKHCVDLLVRQNSSLNKPIPTSVPVKYPHGFEESNVQGITESVITDYILSKMRKRTKDKPRIKNEDTHSNNSNIRSKKYVEVNNYNKNNEIVRTQEKEFISKVEKPQIEDKFELLMEKMIQRFGGIEEALKNIHSGPAQNQPQSNNMNQLGTTTTFGVNTNPSNLNNIPIPNNNNGYNNEIDMEKILEKVRHKIKSGINVQVDVNQQASGNGGNGNNRGSNNNNRNRRHARSESKNQPNSNKKDKNDSNLLEDFTQIFNENVQIDVNQLDSQVPAPHMINVKDFELSDESSYVSMNKFMGSHNELIKNQKEEESFSSNVNSNSQGQILSRGISFDRSQISNNKHNKKKNNNNQSMTSENESKEYRTPYDLFNLKNANENIGRQIFDQGLCDEESSSLNEGQDISGDKKSKMISEGEIVSDSSSFFPPNQQ